MRPTMVTTDSTMCDCNHMCVIQTVLAAELSEICDRVNWIAAWINKTIVCFDILALPHAIAMGPAFIRLQFTLASRQSMHRTIIQMMLITKFFKANNYYFMTLWVTKSFPYLNVGAARSINLRSNVK